MLEKERAVRSIGEATNSVSFVTSVNTTPPRPFFERLTIVGVGLIGGSLARAVRQRGLAGYITGMGRGEENLKKALELGVIDDIAHSIPEGISSADLIVLATPVCTIPPLLKAIAPFLRPGAIVTDVGSVKGPIVEAADRVYGPHNPFVGGHPIAGTEHSGVEASFPSLFEKRKCILTPSPTTNTNALETIKLLWTEVGADVVTMEVVEHDMIMGVVSHLPHIVAYALVNTVDRVDRSVQNVYGFTAGGFKDFTRIASSHPEMWRDICLMNREMILEAIDHFSSCLSEMRTFVEQRDAEGLTKAFLNARNARLRIPT